MEKGKGELLKNAIDAVLEGRKLKNLSLMYLVAQQSGMETEGTKNFIRNGQLFL